MTIQECYASMGADFDGVMSRLMREKSVSKFALMFPQDESFASLKSAYAQGDIRAAFLAAHSLKGLAVNLGFNDLFHAASAVTEEFRGGEPSADTAGEMALCEAEYEKVCRTLAAYAAEKTD